MPSARYGRLLGAGRPGSQAPCQELLHSMRRHGSLELSPRIVRQLLRLSGYAADREICGFLIARPDDVRILEILPIPNIAPDPSCEYEMDPSVVREVWLSSKDAIAGTFHSHPHGPALCSPRDRALIRSTKFDMAIVSPSTLEIRVYGLFDADTVLEFQQYRLTAAPTEA